MNMETGRYGVTPANDMSQPKPSTMNELNRLHQHKQDAASARGNTWKDASKAEIKEGYQLKAAIDKAKQQAVKDTYNR